MAMQTAAKRWIGLHERLETPRLHEELERLDLVDLARWESGIARDEAAPAVGSHLARLLTELSLAVRESDEATWRARLEELRSALEASDHPFTELVDEIPTPPFRRLLEIVSPDAAAVGQMTNERPDTPLSVSALLTGSARTPSLISQIRRELLTADRADWLVSFIKWSGIRPLKEALQRFTETPAPDGGPRLRVATTSYLGATDLKAVEFLTSLPHTEVRASFDTHRTRLHAKAYTFHRLTGFGSSYVGSANVSKVALDEGLEWTAKISQHELPQLWRQLTMAFESHWDDPAEFEPVRRGELFRLKAALEAEKSASSGNPAPASTFFELRPYAFQQEILDAIARERAAGLHRHLVIAATGTGKTMVAAFDYQRVIRQRDDGIRPALLFVGHRKEILQQALNSFRHVLRDNSFGDLLVGDSTPAQHRHLFCSVQSWHSRKLDELTPSHFDYVVLDEAHHASADSYQALLAHLQPNSLLGLTATPERTDGRDIRDDFGDRYTHEIRMPDAIEQRLLAPFHYFGIGDHPDIDLSGLDWQRGGYVTAELQAVLGANDARARWVFDHLQDTVADPGRIRALGFCVSREHAHFMARRFVDWGLPAVALTADSTAEERRRVQSELVQRRIRIIFTVDLYNEGVDIPVVDTLLLLRPTESLTIYLQQLGRGLRLHDEKPHLTVLDFVAPQHRRFRYADRFRALSNQPRRRVDQQIEHGFPWLPSGCLVDLDRVAREHVLDNIRQQLGMRRPQLIQQLRQLVRKEPASGYRAMLDWLHLDEPDELLRHGPPCLLRAEAHGQELKQIEQHRKPLTRGLRQLAQCDDMAILETLATHLEGNGAAGTEALPLTYALLWPNDRPGDGSLAAIEQFIRENEAFCRDLLEIIHHHRSALLPASGIRLESTGPLELHTSYSREQILLGLGKGSLEKPHTSREGVVHVPERRVDAFFVTIDKAEADFSPTTLYEDYAITDRLFHWQSQSRTTPESPTGQRYIHHRDQGYQPMLFVRPRRTLANGLTAPFHFCGPLRYQRHEGSQPMSIVWELEYPLPAHLLREARLVG
ncbi:DUF3427 domain-containing protein [Guyparkeria sp.]|uniref:DUF3427 domain-containing protein n=1 Tax=Guyparkeria sp. TaxID=2035736 RepID=UPI0039710D3F